MTTRKLIHAFSVLFLLFSYASNAQVEYVEQYGATGSYAYQYVKNDPTQTRIYTLKNGLKVYLSRSNEMPRMQTCIAVRTGSKNDPADATGLAHYLEHMLFKGTEKFSTKDYVSERPLLDQIENTYELYRQTKDEAKRKAIYHTIDSLSGVAAKFAIPNEYDKLCSEMGVKGSNAFTSTDVTCYIGDVPVNQLEKWCMLESERFKNPIMRLFHTELEAVYEEKNRGLDSDSDLCFESLLASLYQKHGYGTKTTIGTIEHLKNPSIKEIRKYFEKYYVANNMALCLSGDFDPDQAIVIIDKYFSSWKGGKDNAQMTFPSETMMTAPIEKTITGPEEASVYIAYRTPPVSLKKHNLALEMINKMLYNGQAGLIDLNLVEKQKVIYAYAGIEQWTDGGFMLLNAKPMPGNSLEQTKDLLLAEIEKIKKGEFSDELMKAIAANLAKEDYQKFESYKSRAFLMVNSFIAGEPWMDIVGRNVELGKINREFIIKMANLYFQNNYVVIYKKTGERANQVKVEKPQITPVTVNREDRSPFYKQIFEQKVSPVSPKFVDLDKDIAKTTLKPGMTLKLVKNTVNPLFSLEYVWKIGKLNDPVMAFAAEYLQYLGTKAMSSAELKMKMYALACEYSINVMDNEMRISISGLDNNLEKAAELVDGLLRKAAADKPALENMIAAILQERADERKNRDVIRDAINQYGLYGQDNKYTVRLKDSEMKALKPADLIKKIKSLSGILHDVYYYGPRDNAQLSVVLNNVHKTGKNLAEPPAVKRFVARDIAAPVVFFANYPDMAQAEMTWSMKSGPFEKDLMPQIRLYNEYFGGGMAGIVFQTIRESKALAYSTYSSYRTPYTKEEPFTMLSYVGTQADKISEAAPAMTGLIENMPESENLLEMSKKSIKNVIETERIIKQSIIYYADNMNRLGLSEDIRKSYYEKIPGMSFAELKRFTEKNIKGKKMNMMVLGDEKKVDFNVLSKYGKVEKVSLDQIFGDSGAKP